MNYKELLNEGVEAWNQWRVRYPDWLPDLSGVDLSCCYLFDANLNGLRLRGANLSRTCLIGADLSRSDLRGANLSGAYLSKANLRCANLHLVNLSGANLSEADVSNANLADTQLTNVELSGAKLLGTYLTCQTQSLSPFYLSGQGKLAEKQTLCEGILQPIIGVKAPRFSPFLPLKAKRQGYSLCC